MSEVDALRFRLILGKFQIVKIDKGQIGTRIVIDLGNNVRMTADVPIQADVRIGDRITFYTELLAKDPLNDLTKRPSIQ